MTVKQFRSKMRKDPAFYAQIKNNEINEIARVAEGVSTEPSKTQKVASKVVTTATTHVKVVSEPYVKILEALREDLRLADQRYRDISEAITVIEKLR